MRPRWVPELQCDDACQAGSGVRRLAGLPRAELLQSSLARPQQLLAYGEQSPSLAQLAAAYGFALARNHCFSDGNKAHCAPRLSMSFSHQRSGLTAAEEDAADTILASRPGS